MKTSATRFKPAKSAVQNSSERTRWIVRHCSGAYPHMCKYLTTVEGFADLCRLTEDATAKSKSAHLKSLVADSIYLLQNYRHIRKARELVAFGMIGVVIALLLKLGFFNSSQRLFWFGFFVHNPKWFAPLRQILRLVDSPKVRFVLFSEFEKKLYAQALKLDDNRMVYMPYGEMIPEEAGNRMAAESSGSKEEEFYFSGGYSNRNYPLLIDVFRNVPYRLVIACSPLNKDVDSLVISPNITILRNISSAQFDEYVARSKACILPMRHNTGAAGQSCLLRYMKNKKLIIATETDIVREYIEDGISGILVQNDSQSLASVIRTVEENPSRFQGYGLAARGRFERHFSYAAMCKQLSGLFTESSEGLSGHLTLGKAACMDGRG